MKKLVQQKPEALVFTSNEADEEKFYGVRHTTFNDKGFVTRTSHQDGDYKALITEALTKGNCWDQFHSPTLEGLFQKIDGNFEIFEFETFKELGRWLIEDKA